MGERNLSASGLPTMSHVSLRRNRTDSENPRDARRSSRRAKRNSDTERTESEPNEIQSRRTLKRSPDTELPASFCSLRYLQFKFSGSICFSDNWRFLA